MAYRYAALYRDRGNWTFHKCDEWTRLVDIDRWCSEQADQLKRIQVFNERDELLLDRVFHNILEEVT